MTRPLIYMIAGEPSGDLLGARLMAGLLELTGGEVDFAGIGGEAMREKGMPSLFPQADLAVMGLAEVLPRIPRILKRLKQTMADIAAKQPAAIITIDSWGFTGRVAKQLKAQGSTVPRIHYVAPMVWAWKEKRVHQLAARVDLLMCLLPNEPDYFTKAGLPAVHVGHSVLESGAERGDAAAFRTRHAIPAEVPLLCVLPGSRRSETSRLLPVFAETVTLLAAQYPGLQVVVPTVETVADEVAAVVSAWPLPVTVVRGTAERYG
ncbi:MAG TPA: lipid-A-disaccharide synthase, partial [Patescibacteria group bacterium]|nr:lipid-A-disaccharide synthase [Patescibacteria group bacterium]